MKKFKGVLSMVLALIIAVGMTACNTPAPPSPQPVSPDGASTTPPAEKEDITLTLWSQWSSDADGMKKPLDTVLANFQAENPHIKVEMDTINTEAYKQKIKVAAAADELPDLLFSWGGGFAKPFIDAGKILDLTPYVNDEMKAKLLPGTLDNFTYDGKIYALPSYIGCMVLYCNEELFEQNNVALPQTFDELLAAIKAFNAVDITPIAVGEKELWPGILIQNILAVRTAGVENSIQALNKMSSFDTPEFRESGDKLAELVQAGAFSPGCMGVEELEAESDFANGKAAMIYMGDWAAATFHADNVPVKGKVVIRNFPAITGGKDPGAVLGGAIDTFMASASTKHPAEAAKLLAYICEHLGQEGYLSGASLPAWKGETQEGDINPLTQQIMALSNQATGFMLAWDTVLEGADADTHLNAVAELFGGKATGADFVKAMESIMP